jgi:hypothetical protein
MQAELMPLPDKTSGVGSDLTVSFLSTLDSCEMTQPERQLVKNGNFTAHCKFTFVVPDWFPALFPNLLIYDDDSYFPMALSTWRSGKPNIANNWEGQWFLINARIHPNKLPFCRQTLDGLDDTYESSEEVYASLALPRDFGIQPWVQLLAVNLRN